MPMTISSSSNRNLVNAGGPLSSPAGSEIAKICYGLSHGGSRGADPEVSGVLVTGQCIEALPLA